MGTNQHILVVAPMPPPLTGQSINSRLLVEGLREAGCSLTVVNLARGLNPTTTSLTFGRVIGYAEIFLCFFLALLRRPTTVYIQLAGSRKGFLRDVVMVHSAALIRCRIVGHVRVGSYGALHDGFPPMARALMRRTLNKLESIIILSERLRFMFEFDASLQSKVVVVPNGLAKNIDTPPAPKKLPATASEPVRLLFLSNLIESKGYFDVLEALDLLRNTHQQNVICSFHGRIIANPADDVTVTSRAQAQEKFDNFVRAKGLEQAVEGPRLVDGDEKEQVLRDAHILLLPTNYNNEAQPVAILEALAYGCPVIATNYRAIPDLVQDSKTGFIVDYQAPQQIAEKVLTLIAAPDQYHEMSKACLAHFQAHFTRQTHLKRIMDAILDAEAL